MDFVTALPRTLKEIVVIERYNSLSTIAVTVRCGLPGQVMIVVYAVTPWRRMVYLNHLRGALITDILLYSIRVIEYNDGREIVFDQNSVDIKSQIISSPVYV